MDLTSREKRRFDSGFEDKTLESSSGRTLPPISRIEASASPGRGIRTGHKLEHHLIRWVGSDAPWPPPRKFSQVPRRWFDSTPRRKAR